jgi:hypothetical protein
MAVGGRAARSQSAALRRCRATLLVAVVLGLSAGTSLAEESDPPVHVATKIEPEHVTIGTPFRYTMRVEAKEGVELVVPLLAERIGDFTVADFGESPARGEGGKIVSELWYSLV